MFSIQNIEDSVYFIINYNYNSIYNYNFLPKEVLLLFSISYLLYILL
jgi:hypothetical protein